MERPLILSARPAVATCQACGKKTSANPGAALTIFVGKQTYCSTKCAKAEVPVKKEKKK